MSSHTPLLILIAVVGLGACATRSVSHGDSTGFGPNPALPEPESRLFPVVNIAPTKGWAPGTAPKASSGFSVKAYATHLEHPRWLYVLPNGDVLVAGQYCLPMTSATASGV